MRFTDIFIQRPVLATVISLLILVLGIRSFSLLSVRQYPRTENAVITISTVYTGADPALVAGFITTPLESSIAQAQGIDYLTSRSTQGLSLITANLQLNYDANKALTEINTRVNAVLNRLPEEAQQPTLRIDVGESIDSMYLSFYSQILATNQITDYLTRVVQPKLQTIPGVQNAEILGERQFALRAWLDPQKLAAYRLNASDIAQALADNNFITAAGRTKGNWVTIDLTASTQLTNVEAFKNLILKAENGALIRLRDVAKIELGAENYDTSVQLDNQPAVYIGIKVAPTANVLTVTQNIRTLFPYIQQELPRGLEAKIVYDESLYIHTAIKEVIVSLIEALFIVTGVIFLFLGSLRSVMIPVIAMPLSLIGTFLIMLWLGYSINLLTLLAFVLAIGLVVDDAIIVVENIHRYIEEKKSPLAAALQGARELAIPIISISVVLIAVYLPIGFMGGLTGALFSEFAFTLAGAVTLSAIIALTLSPMMCAKLLKPTQAKHALSFISFIDNQFTKLRLRYERALKSSLHHLPVTCVFALIILGSLYFLYASSKSELAPQEDQGIILSLLSAAPNATLQQTQFYSEHVFNILTTFPETNHVFQVDGSDGLNASMGGMVLKPWDQRQRTSNQLQPKVQQALNAIPGTQIAVFQKPSLPGGGSGLPVQFVITTADTYLNLYTLSQRVLDLAEQSGLFIYIDSDLKLDKPQTTIELDREKIAQMGLTMTDIGQWLSAALSESYINYFDFFGRSYQVIPQVMQESRLNAEQLLNYYLTLKNGLSIPFSTFARLKTTAVPEAINHFQQLHSATLSGVPLPGISLGDALNSLKNQAKKTFPPGYFADYAGQSRQYQQERSALILTFFMALIIIFLCLAAQFESFRDPLIILISVPMSICGALVFISLGIGGASLNIYTEVGLVTLIGLISKHGILIVQFANDLQKVGHSKREAIQLAAGIRLRPILMTTAATVFGVIPLITATGAGAMSRFNIGLVIATGISIGTLFTLFVVPAIYLLLAGTHSSSQPTKKAT